MYIIYNCFGFFFNYTYEDEEVKIYDINIYYIHEEFK